MAYDLVGQIFVPQEASSSGQMPKLRQLRPDQTTEIEKMLKVRSCFLCFHGFDFGQIDVNAVLNDCLQAALLYQLRLAELNTKSSCVMQ
jgi:hypothetical protein